jgi:hypothetical protein
VFSFKYSFTESDPSPDKNESKNNPQQNIKGDRICGPDAIPYHSWLIQIFQCPEAKTSAEFTKVFYIDKAHYENKTKAKKEYGFDYGSAHL